MNLITRISNLIGKKQISNPSAWFSLGKWGDSTKRTTQELFYGTVFSCIDVIGQGVASLEPELYEDDGDGSPDQVPEHDILNPLKKANRVQSGADILYLTSAYIDIYGAAYLYPVKNLAGYPIEIYALDPKRVRTVKSKTELVAGYVYQGEGQKIPFDVEELAPIVRPNPFDQVHGISTIEMARLEAEIDLDAMEYNKGFFSRGARPDGLLYTEQEDPIDENVFQRLKEQWQQVYGGKRNAHKTVILEQGLKYQQLSLNQKDMDFIQQRKFSRDEILAIFRVPKTVLAISDDVNRASAESGEYVFAKYTLRPRLQMIYDKLNAFYVPMFKNTQKMFLDFENPVPEDEKVQADIRASETNTIKTINESRAEIGLPEVENGDQLYIPLNLVPLSFNDNPTSDSSDDETPPKDKQHQTKTVEVGLETKLAKVYQMKNKERNYLLARKRFMNAIEKRFTNANRQLYSDLIREVRNEPIKKDIDDTPEIWFEKIMPRLNAFKVLSTGVFLRYLEEIYKQSQEHQEKYFGIEVNFDLAQTGAAAWLKAEANDTATSVRDSMLDKARLVIAREMEQPEFSVQKAKQAVLSVMKDEADYRALRIARTETTRAYETAAYNSYLESKGIVERVKWLVFDPCEICEPNGGEVRELGEEFPSGHLHPDVHPNCMCSTAPYYGI